MNAGSPATLSDLALYETALQHSANAIALCEAVRDDQGTIVDFRYLFINRHYEQFTDRPAQEIHGQLATVLFPNAVAAGVWQRAAEVVITGQQYQQELYYTTNLGYSGWFDLTISRWEDRGVVISFMEVSEQKNRILAEREQALLLQEVIGSSFNGIMVLQSIRNEHNQIVDFRFKLTNQATKLLSGYTAEQIAQSTFLTLFPTTRLVSFPDKSGSQKEKSIFDQYIEVVETGKSVLYDLSYPHDGLEGWYWTSVSKLNDGLIVTFQDISELKESQQQLERTVRELKRTNQSLEQFAYVASHDLQEPLRKIQSFSDLLFERLSHDTDEGIRDLIQRMQSSAHRMQGLVKDLLAYSRLTSRQIDFDAVVLNRVLERAMDDLQPLIEEKQAVIEIDLLPVIPGDAAQLQQLFFCLLNNALVFHKPDTVPRLIVSATVPDKNSLPPQLVTTNREFVTVSIQDDGIGFEEKYLDRIFTIFQRLHGRSRYKGNGIGLALARKIVENHSGLLTAHSQVNQGSTFTAWLPVN
ncbi:ATP-binding protein [Spirosoma soli]|uniref:histidine kinase n=1 Tax=Spirosoma soli TaxID=1770529 RepID=A0ABW5M2W7_9BACT